MIPERAVEAAFEGIFCFDCGETIYFAEWSDFGFDPAFWRALGKAKGWPIDDPTEPIPPDMTLQDWKLKRPWGRAMRFYDLAYSGGDLKAYWDELLG